MRKVILSSGDANLRPHFLKSLSFREKEKTLSEKSRMTIFITYAITNHVLTEICGFPV